MKISRKDNKIMADVSKEKEKHLTDKNGKRQPELHEGVCACGNSLTVYHASIFVIFVVHDYDKTHWLIKTNEKALRDANTARWL